MTSDFMHSYCSNDDQGMDYYYLDSSPKLDDNGITPDHSNFTNLLDDLTSRRTPRRMTESSEAEPLSELTSIKSPSLQPRYKNGRKYQSLLPDRYGLPNDEQEQDREGFKHRLFSDYVLEGKHFIAPVGSHPQKIVDLGCGAGHWSMEVAECFPNARVIASDISSNHLPCCPGNLEFQVEDLDDDCTPWTDVYRNADLIYLRSFLQTIRNSSLVLQRAFESLKPGGWIECHEVVLPVTWEDGTPAPAHPLSQLYERMSKGAFMHVYGWDTFLPQRLPAALEKAGFVNVSQKHTHAPIGRWHRDQRMREMGLLSQSIIIDWIGAVMSSHEEMDMTEDEADACIRDIMSAVENPQMHARLDWAVFWAQKPHSPP